MNWVLIFPTWLEFYRASGSDHVFLVFMNLSVMVTIAALVAFQWVLTANTIQTAKKDTASMRRHRWNLLLVFIAVLAGFVYLSLFSNPAVWTTSWGENIVSVFTGSVALFGIYYCLFFPVLVGLFTVMVARLAGTILKPNAES